MGLFGKDAREILVSQMVLISIGIVTGTILAMSTDKILLVPGMLILLPGFLEMRGNISGSFASRLSSGLFLGVVKPDKYRTKIVKGNLIASFLLVLAVALILGIIAFLINLFMFGIFSTRIIAIPLIAGMIANAIEIPLTLFMTFYFFRKGHDPNNIIGPFVSTSGDITSIVAMLIALVIV
jgi:mgtE-like transporter